ncbi:type 1 fimbrial protein [Erwinia tasmaniensis]|nr:type 1 fimbrial protein [Erwinia tasmaniensis]
MAVMQGDALASEQRAVVASGQVHFSGQIYEPACQIQVETSNVSSDCFNQGKMARQPIDVSTSDVQTFNQNRTRSQLNWLDSAQRQGLLTISYR